MEDLKLSQWINVLKSSKAIIHVKVELKINISQVINPDDRDGGDVWNTGFQFHADMANHPRRF
jgi:hypothetical protein